MPTSLSALVAYLVQDIGLLLVLALAGAALLARSSRSTLLALALLGGAALLPLAQMRLGEDVSFEKHLGYSALFLAPLAGRALGGLTRRRLGGLLVVALVWTLGVTGLARSMAMYQWPDVRPVVELVEEAGAPPGQYLSTARPHPGVLHGGRPEHRVGRALRAVRQRPRSHARLGRGEAASR